MSREILIEKLAYGGMGLGYLDGKVCFVEGALPGEHVTIRVTKKKKNYAQAMIEKVLESSPQRLEPPCPYLHACGGCQYQHVAYAEELRWKEIQVRELFATRLKIPGEYIQPIRGSAEPYGYRQSVTLHRKPGQPDIMGFIGQDNQTIVPVAKCLLTDPRLDPVYQTKNTVWDGPTRMTFRLDAEGRVHADKDAAEFSVAIGGRTIATDSRSFFQTNLEMTAAIAAQVKIWTQTFAPDIFLDLFAGAGIFALLAGPDNGKLICIEENPAGVACLRKNMGADGRVSEVLQGKVEHILPGVLEKTGGGRLMAFLDPPRQGLEPALASFLAGQNRIEQLVYLSCHLGSLVRDLGEILGKGPYQLEMVIPYDMFPRTKHIEILCLLKRKKI